MTVDNPTKTIGGALFGDYKDYPKEWHELDKQNNKEDR